MRIRAIELSWFRGAADPVSLDLAGKSMVVYGPNGSGKSSFVDAVEYVLKDGKVEHLAHEYSGRRQEKALRNTHTPNEATASLSIKLQDRSDISVEIQPDGTRLMSGEELDGPQTWDYRRTVLRQAEVAEFIVGTKGEKYSALLPLLGLGSMETAAENLRRIAKSVEDVSGLSQMKGALNDARERREAAFGDASDQEIAASIGELHRRCCPEGSVGDDLLEWCTELGGALEAQIAASSEAERRYVILHDVASLDLGGYIDAVRVTSFTLADSAEPLITERMRALQAAGAYADGLKDEAEVECPACGRIVSVSGFQHHIAGERTRLEKSIAAFEARNRAIADLCRVLTAVKMDLGKTELTIWREELLETLPAECCAFLADLNPDALRASCGEDDLRGIEMGFGPVREAASAASQVAPPGAGELARNQQTVAAAAAVAAIVHKAAAIERAEDLVSFIGVIESGVREELRLRSESVISDISDDVQTMWGILHPDEPIDDVHLYQPKDADKAIDVGLRFHGVEQNSPRLTLSEGHRNSLGLCIFLAMAKREAREDRPVFLDDVVISIDRSHRGMIVELLETQFSDRQVVILTHDRDWYPELRNQLDNSAWRFQTLLPYTTPSTGIRWSQSSTTFGDARAHLQTRPDSAGNDARKIMDSELPNVAERLRVRMPFLRAERNDRRMAHDFLGRLIGEGKRCFERRDSDGYVACADEIRTLEEADRLLISWGNRGSHTFDVERPEASKLITACEKSLEIFTCTSCRKSVWYADAGGHESVQCQCGQIRWRYGRA